MKLKTGYRYYRRDGSITPRVETEDLCWFDVESGFVFAIDGDGKVLPYRDDPCDLVEVVIERPDAKPPMPEADYRRFALLQGSGAFAKSEQFTRDEYLAFVRETFDSMLELIEKKNRDYCGPGDDPFANFRRSKAVNVEPINGLAVRFLDKVGRIESFLQAGKLENESFEDAWLDVIGYACLALGMLRERK
jgi:hypothetical protein